jgi:drug/metabolite transporter (DMT)-like permease
VWTALVSLYLIWGSTYLFIRVMVETIPPLLGGGVRFVIAGAIMLVALIARRRSVAADRRGLLSAAAIGTLLAAGGNGLVTVAEKHIPSGLAALLVASMPLWIVVLRSCVGDRVRALTIVGVLAGFTGLAVLLLAGKRPEHAPLGFCLLVLFAAVCWAAGSFLSARLPLPPDPLVSTGWQMLFGGLVLVVAAVPAGELGQVHHVSAKSLGGLAYLVVIGSIVAYSAFTWLLQHAPISKVSTYAYVNPVVAVLLGWAFLSEDVPPTTAVATAIIVASVATIVRTESGARRRSAGDPAAVPLRDPA